MWDHYPTRVAGHYCEMVQSEPSAKVTIIDFQEQAGSSKKDNPYYYLALVISVRLAALQNLLFRTICYPLLFANFWEFKMNAQELRTITESNKIYPDDLQKEFFDIECFILMKLLLMLKKLQNLVKVVSNINIHLLF